MPASVRGGGMAGVLLVSVHGRNVSDECDSREVSGECEAIVVSIYCELSS